MIATVDEIKTIIGIDHDTDTYDSFIAANLPAVQNYILAYTNNYFENPDVYVSGKAIAVKSASTIQITGKGLVALGFFDGCDIYIKGSLNNNGLFKVVSIASDTFTIDSVDKLIDENSFKVAYIQRSDVPESIKLVAALMIQHLLRKHGLLSKEIEAERIGDYQISYLKQQGGDSAYPPEVNYGLNAFCKAGFVSAF